MSPSPYVQDIIWENKFGYLSQIPLFQNWGEELCNKEFRIVAHQFAKVQEIVPSSKISLMEAHIKDDLCQLAEDIVREVYGVPDDLKINTEISGDFDNQLFEHDICCEVSPELQDEINKRILLNCLCHGAAIHSWKTIHHMIHDDLEKLSPGSMKIYDDFTRGVQMSLWQIQGRLPQITQGNIDINFGDTEIDAQGNNLPVLLHELVKGVVCVWTAWGIPNLPEEQMHTLYAIADAYEDEWFHYLMGPSLWRALVEALDVYPHELADAVTNLSLLTYEELEDVLTLCIQDTEVAKRKLRTLNVI